MYYYHCTRNKCFSKNNFGKKVCHSCNLTLKFAIEVNTSMEELDGNISNVMKSMGVASKSHFYGLVHQIPEISDAWTSVKGVEINGIRKIMGSDNVINQANANEIKWSSRMQRETDYTSMPEWKQEKFMEWVFSQDTNRLSFKDAREKLLEYNKVNEVITI